MAVARRRAQERGPAADAVHPLDAGRGNPDFLATTPRLAMAHLMRFAADTAASATALPGLGFRPPPNGIAARLERYVKSHSDDPSARFLADAVRFSVDELGLEPDGIVFELADAALGDYYPQPPRIQRSFEPIVAAYLSLVLCDGDPLPGPVDLFATEGATGGIVYAFRSLRVNRILRPGDRIAIATPVFSPYLQIPKLHDYDLVPIGVEGNEDEGWQIPDSQIDKLADHSIKVFFLVNPANPPAVSLNPYALERIAAVVRDRHPTLIVLPDNVYATFVRGFRSLITVLPHNTIDVYSYSKYFGVTGWRLGVVMMHEDNVVDRLISDLPAADQRELRERYRIESVDPEKIKFIDRMEMDSRDVALAHTGGISGPQQAMMCLLSLAELIDSGRSYRIHLEEVVRLRFNALYEGLGLTYRDTRYDTHYYALIDLLRLAEREYGREFASHLEESFEPIDPVFRLAEDHGIVVLPGQGFGAPAWSVRVSLANLPSDSFEYIGRSIRAVVDRYHGEWKGGAPAGNR